MHVLFFAHLRDLTGCDQVALPLDVADPDKVWDHLVLRFPGIAPHRASLRWACNGRYVGEEARFVAGDELALIPPVSGG